VGEVALDGEVFVLTADGRADFELLPSLPLRYCPITDAYPRASARLFVVSDVCAARDPKLRLVVPSGSAFVKQGART
jgi:hypothetical protein